MTLLDIILTGISLSMDAFAVSIGKGLTLTKNKRKKSVIISLYFGLFQMIMPLLGYFLGSFLNQWIKPISRWISFSLLVIVGMNMVKEENQDLTNDTGFKTMIPLAIATSLDAFTIGITFAFLNTSLLESILIIGCITTTLCYLGVRIGSRIKNNDYLEELGGWILILLGLKIIIIG